ncbi:MAG: hypothetical protein ACK4NZ_04620 [Tsuneonella sp.]|uniref:hypothetical protein n=1 Tax=Sphingomonas sp. TaxID=28214 RepID=UPI002E120FF0|nr:hypothetical protein [Sphingomonas sp.]
MSIVGRVAQLRFLSKFHWRALLMGGAAALFLVLTYFPERHLASSSFTPSDRDALGLSGTLGQLGALSSVFGNQAAVEVALRIGNSDDVRDKVIAATPLLKTRLNTEGRVPLQRYLSKRVEVRSLRGGIIVIEMQDRDAELARAIVTAYQTAVQAELGEVSRRQTAYKRNVLAKLVKDASAELGTAQAAYDAFRLRNRYAEPRAAMSAFGDRIPQLETAIRSKQIQLATARQVFTENNLTVQQIAAELAELRRQLADAKSTSPTQDQGVAELIQNSSRLYQLERDLEIAKALYNNYVRYLRGTSVEDLTADANLRVLEQPHVDTKRQIWLPALALALAILLIWIAIEAYRLRPPPGGAAFKKVAHNG